MYRVHGVGAHRCIGARLVLGTSKGGAVGGTVFE